MPASKAYGKHVKEDKMADKQKIGWIGLGKMGIPMSQNLAKAGYPLTVYNRTKAKTKEVEGAKVADSPKALAADADVIRAGNYATY